MKRLPGYHKDIDAVSISYDGTTGEIIEIEGLRIMLPKKPDEVYKRAAKKADQFFQRQPLPPGFNKDNYKIFENYIDKQFYTKKHGFWFMNNGVPEYITGAHWFLLQWCKSESEPSFIYPEGEYFYFTKAQQKLFYYFEAAWCDDRSFGVAFVKPRRFGATASALAFSLCKGITKRNGLFGLTSVSKEVAYKAYERLGHMFKGLPPFFQPANRGVTKDGLQLRAQDKKTTSKTKQIEYEDSLNTEFDYQPTMVKSYDSRAVTAYISDECYGIGTKILMCDMSFKNIEDIRVGDYVMVEGGKVLMVKSTTSGVTNMYKIKQSYGRDYIVSENHRLYLNMGNCISENKNVIIKAKDFYNLGDKAKSKYRRVCFSGVEFDDADLVLDPYVLGVWLGDGSYDRAAFVFNKHTDIESREYIEDYFQKNNYSRKVRNEGENFISYIFRDNDFGKEFGSSARFQNIIRSIGVYKNKHIPKKYMTSSISQRLDLLAGIIDSDGCLSKNNSYVIGLSNKTLVVDIYNLCKSLGLDCSEVRSFTSNFNTPYHTIAISDYDRIIPVKLQHKKGIKTKKVNRRGNVKIEYYGVADFYGITVDSENIDDQRLILEDYTISMNSSKWPTGENIVEHWSSVRKTLTKGAKITGKTLMITTIENFYGVKDPYSSDSGSGDRFMYLYDNASPKIRNKNGRTYSGLYKIFISCYEHYEGMMDLYGYPILETPEKPIMNAEGQLVEKGIREYIEDEMSSYKNLTDLYNELRKTPRSEDDLRKVIVSDSLFNLVKINQQIEHENRNFDDKIKIGNFVSDPGKPGVNVRFVPCDNGRFWVSWLPHTDLQNKYIIGNNQWKYPVNDQVGCFGVDPYKLDQAVGGSLGAIHGFSKINAIGAPSNNFFLEYIDKPPIREIFFEDVINACTFYSMPALIESNIPELLVYMHKLGFTNYIMRRPDKAYKDLTSAERKYGGIPSNGSGFIKTHAACIQTYIDDYIGVAEEPKLRPVGEMGNMPFTRTLADWAKFDLNDRTKRDASISSGLALFGAQKFEAKQLIKEAKTLNIPIYGVRNGVTFRR